MKRRNRNIHIDGLSFHRSVRMQQPSEHHLAFIAILPTQSNGANTLQCYFRMVSEVLLHFEVIRAIAPAALSRGKVAFWMGGGESSICQTLQRGGCLGPRPEHC